jgi:hypothetical protein
LRCPLADALVLLLPPQVKVAVVAKTVSVRHSPAAASPATLAAALNEARLEASLLPPRRLSPSMRSWMPAASTLVAVALLMLSCLHYLAKPTGWLPGCPNATCTAVFDCRGCTAFIKPAVPYHAVEVRCQPSVALGPHCAAVRTPGVNHLQHTKWIALAAVALKLPHIMLKAAAALRHCTLDINTLMTIAVAGAAAQMARAPPLSGLLHSAARLSAGTL